MGYNETLLAANTSFVSGKLLSRKCKQLFLLQEVHALSKVQGDLGGKTSTLNRYLLFVLNLQLYSLQDIFPQI